MTRVDRLPIHLVAVAVAAFIAAEARATNLISNGNFSSGNTGFTSQYGYNTNVFNFNGPELAEGAYSVVTKPSDVHFAWGNYFDHTSGDSSGKYFVANASSDTTKTVWQSSAITVSQANTAYRFEAWISKIYQFESNPPVLSFQIGDGTTWTNMGNTASLGSASPGSWLFTYVDGQFSSAGTYYVRLKNSNGASGGNDLGLDDIYFGLRSSSPSVGTTPGTTPTSFNPVAVPEPSTLAGCVVALGSLGMYRLRRRRKVARATTGHVAAALLCLAAVTVAAPAQAQTSWNAYNDFYLDPTAAGWGGATSPSATGAAWGQYMGNVNGVGGFPSSIGTYLSTSQLYRFSTVNPLGVSGTVDSQSFWTATGGAGFARYVDNVDWNGTGVETVPHSSLGSYSVPWFAGAPGLGDGPGGSDLTNLIWMQSAYLSGTSTPSGEGIASVLTWTAPATRTYDFSGLFVSGNDTSKSAAVAITDSLGGAAPLSRTVLANDAVQSFSFSKAYTAGDVVQFQVGNNLSSGNIVGLQVSIVPEPSTWVMGLAGIACAGWGAFRRRKRAVRQRAVAHPAAMLAVLFIALLTNPAHAVTIDMVTVGNAGNANDTTGYGGVAYEYQIGKYDVTIQQYTDFLNAVAATDTYSLYNTSMGTDLNIAGISRSGSSGSYTYSVMNNSGNSANRPITYVSWWDAARFANWMANGQPTGAQSSTTTENGAYNVNGATSGTAPAKNATNPNTSAAPTFYIPTENEWYKAAYYSQALNSGTGGYYTYATQSNTDPGNVIGSGANQANYNNGVYSVTQSSSFFSNQNYLTDVGAFTNSASFYGTFDQSGNVYQWNDLDGGSGLSRGLRGGSRDGAAFNMSSSDRLSTSASSANSVIGFRLAAVPEPASLGLAATGGLVALGWTMLRRRRRLVDAHTDRSFPI